MNIYKIKANKKDMFISETNFTIISIKLVNYIDNISEYGSYRIERFGYYISDSFIYFNAVHNVNKNGAFSYTYDVIKNVVTSYIRDKNINELLN